jgi:hypothetical protein
MVAPVTAVPLIARSWFQSPKRTLGAATRAAMEALITAVILSTVQACDG